MKQYNHSIDIIKGWGIIMVILGHIFLGSAEESIPRYVIYSFHMPLFFFVSGFLLNIDKIGALPISSFVQKYAKRMLGWWFVAWLFYTISVNLMTMGGAIIADYESVPHFIARNLVFPWGHLWFVPGLFITIIVTYCIKRFLKMDSNVVIAVMLLVGMIQMILSYSGICPNTMIIRYHNWLFFAIGMSCSRIKFRQMLGGTMACLLYLALILLTRYIGHGENFSMLNFMLLSGFIILGVAPLIQHNSLPQSAMLQWLGKNSLQIYLWHELPVIVLKTYYEDNLAIYYSVNFAWFFVFLIVVWWQTNRIYNKGDHV